MHINSKERLEGVPLIELRRLLRRCGTSEWDIGEIMYVMKIDKASAGKLLQGLVRAGLVERTGLDRDGLRWRNTVKGNALALASAARPMKRSTASRLVSDFLARARTVNENPYFLYKVDAVTVFGSYLTTAEWLNDIDLVVRLSPKEADNDAHEALCDQRIHEAQEKGRRFPNYTDMLFWPHNEVLLFLKARSSRLSFVESSDSVLKTVATRVIFPQTQSH